MSIADDVLAQARALGVKDRAAIAHELIASLDSEDSEATVNLQRSWKDKIDSRLARLHQGETDLLSAEELKDRLSS